MLFIDADALSKLAHWKILPLLPSLTGIPWSQTATVSTLKYRAHRACTKPDGRLFHCPDSAVIACDLIARMVDAGSPDAALVAPLAGIPDIDPGEAALLALTLQNPGSHFLTGDKRALRGLAPLTLAAQWQDRIWMVEQVVESCLHQHGRDWLLKHVCPFRTLDTAVAMCMGSACSASHADMQAGFTSYIGEIQALRTPSLIAKLKP